MWICFLYFPEPLITASLTENVEATTTNTIAFTYSEEDQAGVFDYYSFTIDVSGQTAVEKDDNDLDRNVMFSNLNAGTEYRVEAKVYSGDIVSTTQKSLKITTRK